MSRRWPLTALASLIGISTIAAPTLVAIFLVDRSGAIGAPSGRVSALGAVGPVATADDVTPSPSPSVAILPPLLPSAPATPDADITGDLVAWTPAFDRAAATIPTVLRDGRAFSVSDVIDEHHVVGVATDRATQGSPRTSAVVIVDPATAKVTATIDTVTNSAWQVAQHTDETEIVGPDAVSGDWIGWLRGRQSDAGVSDATVYVANVVTGERRVLLEHGASADLEALMPRLSGDFVAWSGPAGVHVSSLRDGGAVYTLPLTASSDPTFIDALRAPWLSYETHAGGATAHHLVDLRTGVAQIVSGPCDGAWCEKVGDRVISLVPQGSSGVARVIADQFGGSSQSGASLGAPEGAHAGFVGMAGGFFLWQLDGSTVARYLYDPSSDRDIELPHLNDDVAFMTGHYLVWEQAPADRSPSGTLRFIDIDALPAALTNR